MEAFDKHLPPKKGFFTQKRLQVAGKDVFRFLQGQLSCDMRKVTSTPSYGALCNTKGRVVANFSIFQQYSDAKASEPPVYFIDLPEVMAGVFYNELKKYAAFSDVDLNFLESEVWLPLLNVLQYIRRGQALILPSTSEKLTPHALNYINLGLVSLDKGCYRGQEIIARLHYRGHIKKQVRHVKIDLSDHADVLARSIVEETLVNFVKTRRFEAEALMLCDL